jgi:hypothetical protein
VWSDAAAANATDDYMRARASISIDDVADADDQKASIPSPLMAVNLPGFRVCCLFRNLGYAVVGARAPLTGARPSPGEASGGRRGARGVRLRQQ